MNYNKIYNSLINKAKMRSLKGYHEKHHVIPKCLGGSNDTSNLVKLTPEEHYVAHLLLIKIYPHEPKLVYAATLMSGKNNHIKRNNKQHGWLRRRASEVHKQKYLNKPELKERFVKRLIKMHKDNPEIRIQASQRLKAKYEETPDWMDSVYDKMKGVPPWKSPSSTPKTLKIWKDADKYYQWWLDNQTGYCLMAKAFGYKGKSGPHKNMVDKFRSGWIPRKDTIWLEFVNQYTDSV
ncbi:putative homing endonuclease [Klebsiella phage UPM 2146]|uniref:Putative homing endonuclease n=1 Tax=Klebsiella phage UPM 2146 TaxID=2847816 RepID=A0A5Q2F5S3_9CAUD|nr:homing endonuclease [Klebsiella phage UPM 2146]QGF20538.1 putative homing endonuclease [Klebsiella phage UPM 2146]